MCPGVYGKGLWLAMDSAFWCVNIQLSSQLFQFILYQPLTSDPVDQIISELDSVILLPINWYAKPCYSRLCFCLFTGLLAAFSPCRYGESV